MPITNTDVMLGAEAQVFSLTKGGFIVRQIAGTAGTTPTRTVDTYAADAAAVLALLTTIFTPPPA